MIICLCLYLMILSYFSIKAPRLIIGPMIDIKYNHTFTSQCDSRGVVGWDAVDALSAYLVGLNRTITALSAKDEADIVHLYTALHAMDKKPSRYKIVIILYTRIKHTSME